MPSSQPLPVSPSVIWSYSLSGTGHQHVMACGPSLAFARFRAALELNMVVTFLKVCKTKKEKRIQDGDHVCSTKPKIVTIWSFTEKVC